jgi:Flp pilus assembly protein TadD
MTHLTSSFRFLGAATFVTLTLAVAGCGTSDRVTRTTTTEQTTTAPLSPTSSSTTTTTTRQSQP